MNDHELQRRYQEGMRQVNAPAGTAPDPELIQRVARGEATEAERLRVLDVVMQSEDLRREYDTFRALTTAGGAGGRIPWPKVLTAAVLLVMAGGALIWQSAKPPEDVWRGGGDTVGLWTPATGAVVAAPVVLGWQAVTGAHEYEIEILGVDGSEVSRFLVVDTTAAIPDSTPLVPGSEYTWSVLARLDNGASIRSPYSRFTIQR